MKEIFLVLRNVDFTEGRGPMVFHSTWTEWKNAHAFVMDQYGIMGTKQYLYKEGNITDSKKGIWYYNGYEIRRMQVLENYDKTMFNAQGDLRK